ncbi:hypothetical protein [Streptomyces sp. rh34]|uniref:hypothetical protein n=1 Tax=Streptomyces sp. rh34 TaxID=2034272 RepID=UPI000BF0067F|nr:hypothetical protein [Streptomyces sp. rh34]
MPEDQFGVLWLLADGSEAEEIYRDLVTARAEGPAGEGAPPEDRLAGAVSRTRIALVTGPEELADLLDHDQALLDRVTVTIVDAVAQRAVRDLRGHPGTALGDKEERARRQSRPAPSNSPGTTPSWPRSTAMPFARRTCATARRTPTAHGAGAAAPCRSSSGRAWEAIARFEDGLRRDQACTWLQLRAAAAATATGSPNQVTGAGPPPGTSGGPVGRWSWIKSRGTT